MPTEPHSRILAVDIGNSTIRFGLFDGVVINASARPTRCFERVTFSANFDQLHDWLPTTSILWFVGSVNHPAEQRLGKWKLNCRDEDAYRLLQHDDIPLVIDVENSARVGIDRLTAAVAANAIREPRRPAIIVDAGSAITVDAVTAEGAFVGGAILPGITMSAHALHEQTDQLPNIARDVGLGVDEDLRSGASRIMQANAEMELPAVIGKSTEFAIRSGLIWGAVGSLRLLLERFARELEGDPQVFFAGGDALQLAPLVDKHASTVPDLVLLGIALTATKLGVQ